jgi:hypothetical protein
MQLPSCLIVEFNPDGIQLHALYRSPGGPDPNTKARRREGRQGEAVSVAEGETN